MPYILTLIEHYGLAAVFLNVFIGGLGVPIPAYPTLLIAGALLSHSNFTARALLTVSFSAALMADFSWYLAGRSYGRKVITQLCRISLSPHTCVQITEAIYLRWGAPSLVVAKFIPGFASIGSALAGMLATRRTTFLLFDGLGAVLWAGSAIWLGSKFRTEVGDMLARLKQLGKWGLLLLVLALVAFIASKWWQRRRFVKSLRMDRISVGELHQLRMAKTVPVIVDVRPAYAQRDGRIPGAIIISMEEINDPTLNLADDTEVIVYCDCPNELSAARIAKQLMHKGYTRVRPLYGGIDAWVAAGHALDFDNAQTKEF
ncbi:MAG: sulfurtransferase [Herminiimonas sp.]|nr:sulfurtransferase [Herminiimonas sp.]